MDSVDIIYLPKRYQIWSYRSRLLNAQTHRRHLAAGFEHIRFVNPRDEASDRVFHRARGYCLPAHQMGEIGTEGSMGSRARNRVAVHAGRRLEETLPRGDLAADVRGLALLSNPAIEILSRVDVD